MAIPFNDVTNKTGLVQLFEVYTGLGDGTVSGNTVLLKQATRLMNNTYQLLVTSIFEAQDDWEWDDVGTTDGSSPTQSTYPVATTPLVAGQRDYTFPLSLKIMKILRVDVTYDGTNWNRATPRDSQITSLGLGNDTNTDARFNKSAPYYDIRANAIWLYPEAVTADVSSSAQLRIEFLREPVEFSSSNTANTPGIDTAFQPLIARGAAVDYCITNAPTLVEPLQEKFDREEAKMQRYYSRKDEDQNYQLVAQPVNNY